jgi:ribonuclease D
VNHELISTDEHLRDFCAAASGSERMGMDTEFVSENLFRPQLCLIQVALPDRLALIDSIAIADLSPFWKLVCEGVKSVVTHAAREEFLFCHRAVGRRPAGLFDLQIAAGFVGHEYPAAYSTLVGQLAGKSLSKGETRTDWRLRPLSQRQIQYALQDVEHLLTMHGQLHQSLERRGRLAWYHDEIERWQGQLEQVDAQPSWLRLSGLSRLSRRNLAIVRELSAWRDDTARRLDRSPRKLLPDDLLIEIAKRGEADLGRLKAIRGLVGRVNARHLPEIAAATQAALEVPDQHLPDRVRAPASVSLGILGQFLQTGLNLVCVREQIAPGLVANAEAVRELAARMMGLEDSGGDSLLETGWRHEVVGPAFRDLLAGRLALRIASHNRDQPLELVEWPAIAGSMGEPAERG